MNLEKYIPFENKEFRPYQKKAITDTIDAIESGVQTILLNAPVGSGKSLIGYCVARYLQDAGEKSYIYTKTTLLQEQYLRDFDDLKTAMGRKNFSCLMSKAGHNCDVGVCKQVEKYSCPIGAEIGADITLKSLEHTPYLENCLYWQQKYDAIQNDISILNYPYAIADTMYLQHFDNRKLGVFDEGHSLENVLMSAFELELTDYQIYRDLETNLVIKDTIEEWIEELRVFAMMYKNKSQKDDIDIKTKERFETRSETIEQCVSFLEESPDNWVFNTFKKKNIFAGRRVQHVVFKPIQIQEYTPILFDRVEHNFIMSGSILKSDIFIDELGLDTDSYVYLEIPSIVPPKQRPIVRDYVGSMSQKNFSTNFPALVQKIKEIADNHLGEKGIIHTFTYKINYSLYQELKDDDRFIFHTQSNRVEKTNDFKDAPPEDGDIFVSPYSFEGIDFPYDEARWQILCKMPYPYLGDAQVRARNNMDMEAGTTDWGWCNRQVALTLSQMYGRTNRAVDDFSVTYLLDSDINRYLGPATLVSDYFLEGVVGYNYLTPLVVVDESKIKSRGNNYRNQQIILEDIKNGLNSLGALRREYKKLPSSSYVEVKKAVDYLLKCGAIRYA